MSPVQTDRPPTRAPLEISCAKPGCHWKGSPADAPGHDCPTPAAGEPLVAVEDASVIAEREELFKALDDAGATYNRATTTEGLRELVALTTGKVTEPPPLQEGTQVLDAADAEPAYDSDPVTKDELEAWLSAHGQYDARGVPNDERTAELDARYSVFLGEPEPALEDPPDDEEPETLPIAAEIEDTFGVSPAGVDADIEYARKAAAEQDAETAALLAESERMDAIEDAGPRAWETVIAAALEEQTAVKEYRWLIIWKPEDATRDAELIGRAKIKNEAVVIQEDVAARGELTGEILVAKTADVLQAAAEIEKKRELVEEPATVIEEADDDGETQPAQEEESPGEQTASVAAPATPPPGAKPALFDASDYERADLALPQVDGHNVDRIAVQFSGEVMLDRSNPDHVALWRRLKLGRKTELWVEAKGLGWSGKGATNKDGELDVVVAKRSVTIQTVRILGPEDLGNAAAEVAAQARDALEAQNDREAAAAADADES